MGTFLLGVKEFETVFVLSQLGSSEHKPRETVPH